MSIHQHTVVCQIKETVKNISSMFKVKESETEDTYWFRTESNRYIGECTIWGSEFSEILLAEFGGEYLIEKDGLNINGDDFQITINQMVSYFLNEQI